PGGTSSYRIFAPSPTPPSHIRANSGVSSSSLHVPLVRSTRSILPMMPPGRSGLRMEAPFGRKMSGYKDSMRRAPGRSAVGQAEGAVGEPPDQGGDLVRAARAAGQAVVALEAGQQGEQVDRLL